MNHITWKTIVEYSHPSSVDAGSVVSMSDIYNIANLAVAREYISNCEITLK